MSNPILSASQAHPLLMSVSAAAECRSRNDRQTYFSMTRSLVQAQFKLDDRELSRRLWQEVADRDLDIGRIINLMYGCWFHQDNEEMIDVDERHLNMIVD
jgi:hypothetical protein|tara:strand:+ start:103 stop:402 length:300 start_codon:yes stop_codon:yes gene_type:complete